MLHISFGLWEPVQPAIALPKHHAGSIAAEAAPTAMRGGGDDMTDAEHELERAHALREALLRELLDGWEDAGIRGLCAEGRFEAAVGALRALDLAALLAALPGRAAPG